MPKKLSPKAKADLKMRRAATLPPQKERPSWLPRWGTPVVEFTQERQERFLEYYRATGLKGTSAEFAGISPSAVSALEAKDKDFAASVRAAKDLWVENVLVKAAVRRAVEGVQRPVIGGKFKDEVICHETIYSDGLLSKMLDGYQPEIYKPSMAPTTGASGAAGGVLVIPASPENMDHWQLQFGNLAQGNHGSEVMDADR
jgi:hypothetical protein